MKKQDNASDAGLPAKAPRSPAAKKQKGAPGGEALEGHAERRMSKNLHKSKEQQGKIFEAIAKVMARDNPNTTTMATIASKIGGSKGTLYYYFKTKGEMLYRMQMHAYQLVIEVVYPILDDKSLPPLERLKRSLRAQALVNCKHHELMGVVVTDYALKEAPSSLARVARRTRAAFNRRMFELVQETMAAEGWTCVDPKVVTALMVSLLGDFARWYKKNGRLSAEQMADLLVQYAIYGPFTTMTPGEQAPDDRDTDSASDSTPSATSTAGVHAD